MTLKPKTQRLIMMCLGILLLAAATGAALYGLRDSLVYYYEPAQLLDKNPPMGRKVRLGGIVKEGSISKSSDGSMIFILTDRKHDILVSYTGSVPDLFCAGKGAVIEGTRKSSHWVEAKMVLAKHDETYRPPSAAMKAQP